MNEFLKLGHNACDISRKLILDYYGKSAVEWKADATPVTEADRGAEEAMRKYLKSQNADFGFLGEEYGREKSRNGIQWVMDPIDGTKSFIHQVPLFGTLLAAFDGTKPLAAFIDMPALGQRIYAAPGEGCFLNGEKVQVSSENKLSDSLVLSGTVNSFESLKMEKPFQKIRQESRLYRGWGDCYGYFLVACGRAEVMIDPVVSLWDIAPMPLIFKEAGGIFSELGGNEPDFSILEDENQSLISDNYTGIASVGAFHNYLTDIFKDS